MLKPLFFILLISVSAFTQSYEGTIGKYPVWFDLVVPYTNGAVKGSYFYKKYQKAINLQGSKNGQNLQLTETDVKKRITGYFDCKYFGDSIKGTWSKKSGKAPLLSVVAYKTNSYAKEYFKTDNIEDLPLSQSGGSFRDELERSRNQFNQNSEMADETLELDLSQDRCGNIMFIKINWYSSNGPYPINGTSGRYLYDLMAKEIISFNDQIAPDKMRSFSDKICKEFQIGLLLWRKNIPDSEWVDWYNSQSVGGDVPVRPLDSIFSVHNCPDNIGEVDGIRDSSISLFICDHYFGFPHVMESRDFACSVEIPFKELYGYLKADSPLRGLTKKKNDEKK